MYLTHHYFIDLIGGAALSFVVFQYTRYNHLPVVEANKFCRWSYTEIEKIDIPTIDPLSSHFVSINDMESSIGNSRYNYPYFLEQHNNNGTLVEDFEMSTVSRSRQASRNLLPTTFAATEPAGVSLHQHLVEEEEEDISSMENSATPSVFEDEHHQMMSSTASQTSLEELESTASIHLDTPSSKSYNKSK